MVRFACCALTFILAFAPACNNKPEVDPAEKAAQAQRDLGRAAVHVKDEKWKLAEELLQSVLAADPSSPEAHNLLAQIRLHDKNFSEALTLVDKAIAGKNNVADFHATRATALHESGKDVEAAAAWGKAFELQPDFGAYGLHQGQSLKKAKQWEQAEAVFREVIKSDDAVQYVYSELGDVLREQGKLDEALTTYAKAMNKYQGDKMAYAGAAQVYEAKGDTQNAVTSWSTYIRMDCCSEFSNNVAKPKIAALQGGKAG